MRLESGAGIEYHADDYGMFPTQSTRILQCYRNGRLNGVSVMPNSESLDTCMQVLRSEQDSIALTVHLNLIEGCSLCPGSEIPMLADENGVLCCGFGGLLLRSFLPGRKALKEQMKRELWAQIQAVKCHLPEGKPLRLDGHAHYHMIPVVFDAMMDVIREQALDVSYVRIPREPVGIYLRHLWKLKDFAPINLLKVLILNLLAHRNERKYAPQLQGMEKKVFLGVFLSGRMYWENVKLVLPDAVALANKQGKGLEILAHPGGVYEQEDIRQMTSREDIAFLTSPMRNREASLFTHDWIYSPSPREIPEGVLSR